MCRRIRPSARSRAGTGGDDIAAGQLLVRPAAALAELRGDRQKLPHAVSSAAIAARSGWVGTNLLTTTRGGTEASFDAYTKLAGEGARWRCVRKHGQALQDDSMFFVSHDDATKRGISFRVLWLNWKDVFGKAHDIPDGDVAGAIRIALTHQPATPSTPGAAALHDPGAPGCSGRGPVPGRSGQRHQRRHPTQQPSRRPGPEPPRNTPPQAQSPTRPQQPAPGRSPPPPSRPRAAPAGSCRSRPGRSPGCGRSR